MNHDNYASILLSAYILCICNLHRLMHSVQLIKLWVVAISGKHGFRLLFCCTSAYIIANKETCSVSYKTQEPSANTLFTRCCFYIDIIIKNSWNDLHCSMAAPGVIICVGFAWGVRQRKLILGIWGHSQCPQWGPGAKPLVRLRGLCPWSLAYPEADEILAMETQFCTKNFAVTCSYVCYRATLCIVQNMLLQDVCLCLLKFEQT